MIKRLVMTMQLFFLMVVSQRKDLIPDFPPQIKNQLFRRVKSAVIVVKEEFLEQKIKEADEAAAAIAKTQRELLEREVAKVKTEWTALDAQGRQIRRLYTAQEVAALRIRNGARPDYTVQKAMGNKFYNLSRKHQEKETGIWSLGAFDETSAEAMAMYGLPIYQGGWAESYRWGTADTANYMFTKLKGITAGISRKLMQRQRIQDNLIAQLIQKGASDKEIAAAASVDWQQPLIVDMDTGHGSPMFMVEALLTPSTDQMDPPLIGAVHIEDQAVGCKKCGHLAGKVLVSTQEQIERLNLVRLQLDIMGVPTVVMARTDAEEAEWITSVDDKRDHPFIMGVTNSRSRPLAEVIQEAWDKSLPASEVEERINNWEKNAGVKTLGELVVDVIKEEKLKVNIEEWREFAKVASFKEMKAKALEFGIRVVGKEAYDYAMQLDPKNRLPGRHVLWDADLARMSSDGYTMWMINSGTDMAIARSKAFLPYSDMAWMEQKKPDKEQIRLWAAALDEEAQKLGMSKKPLKAMNISPSFPWEKLGMSDKELQTFLTEMDKYVQFQFITYGGILINHYNMLQFLDDLAENQALALAKLQTAGKGLRIPFFLNPQNFAGVLWVEYREAAGRGHAVLASPTGSRSTVHNF